ncbi:MAG: hypothetical protein IMZ65_01995, partial [Planctomycetes bacterium]|nr:hypothetical protein [Planctomycetota bacterium]
IPVVWQLAAAAAVVAAIGLGIATYYGPTQPPSPAPTPGVPAAEGTPGEAVRGAQNPINAQGEHLVPLHVSLPRPLFDCTPRIIPPSPHLEMPSNAARPPMMVPEGTVNVAAGKPATSSDAEPIIGELRMITDGKKEPIDESYVELMPGRQWVQIDLKEACRIHAIVVWHEYTAPRVYHDVIVQVSDDPEFKTGVTTLYNNDYDNTLGLGEGKDLEYIEDYRGRVIDGKGAVARYVRLYSNGNSDNDANHYVEAEVYGSPAAAPAGKPVPLTLNLPRGVYQS